MKVLIVRHDNVVRRARFETEITIGRLGGCGMQLGSPSVSRRHAVVRTRQSDDGSVDELELQDLGSDNGTYVSGVQIPVAGTVKLRADDIIGIGPYELTVEDEDGFTIKKPAERAMLEAIKASPHDDDLRRVYGDWLEEQGRHIESELVAIEVVLRTVAPSDRRLVPLTDRLRLLANQVHPEWRQRIARPAIENCDAKFVFQCPKTWDRLAPTVDPTIRTCDTCKESVHFAPTILVARVLARQGHCVAVDLAAHRHEKDLEEEPQPTTHFIVGRM